MTSNGTPSPLPSREELQDAADRIENFLSPTPQIHWPLLSDRTGCLVWVKHENHLPTGAFKVRGGLLFLDWLLENQPDLRGVLAATRGNHGQSVAFAAQKRDVPCTVVIPEGNSPGKNRAMEAFGARLIIRGSDFTEAYEFAEQMAREEELALVPSFHPLLVRGVATGGLEFLSALPDLETVYVPIGLGSGICGLLAARQALDHSCEVVGVVAENAPSYALSFAAGQPVSTESSDTLADGVAVRRPDPLALQTILGGVSRIVTVTEHEILHAIRCYFTDTHNLAEGAGAAPLAALLQERDQNAGKQVGLVLSGGNIEPEILLRALA